MGVSFMHRLAFPLLILTAGAYGQAKFPDGPGKDAVLKICGDCHAVDVLIGVGKGREGWAATVDDMVAKGATGSDEELQQIVDYLARNFGKSTAGKVNINAATVKELKEKLDLPMKDAQAVFDYRGAHGSFKSWADLKNVPDLDITRLEAKKDKIAFQ
jgi:competence ComEA-like helix-hairpin-helix protein